MKRTYWLIAYAIIVGGDLIGIQLQDQTLQYICKPLIIPALAGYFLYDKMQHDLTKWILFALFFSWMGDILLMFDGINELYFLLGLSSFLLAHIFYISFFHLVRVKENIGSNPWWLLPVVAYYVGLITLLS